MKKRLLWSAFAMTVLVLLGFFSPLIYWRITGLVRGEAFYAGKPSCYWREVAKEEYDWRFNKGQINPKDLREVMADTRRTWWEKLQGWKADWLAAQADRWTKLEVDTDAVPILRDLFHDSDEEVRAMAAVTISALGEHAPDMLPDLVKYSMTAARDGPAERIMYHMRNFECKRAVPLLCQWLDSDERRARFATYALHGYGESAEDAIPFLLKNMQRENDRGQSSALPWIGPKSIPALKQLLKSDNIYARRNATKALTHWRNSSLPDNFPDLDHLLVQQSRDPDPTVRLCAIGFLLALPAKNADALYSLAKMLHDPDAKVRTAAIRTITTTYLNLNVPELRAILAEFRNIAVFDENADVRAAAKNAVECARGPYATP